MNTELFWSMSPAIIAHTFSAFGALGIGIVMWSRKKGTLSHKLMGRLFLVLMLATAVSAIFIRNLNDGNFSWIHLFVPLTFYASWEAVYHVRKGNIKKHMSSVRGLFFGALLIPGIIAFWPGRLMWHVVFGGP